MKQMEELIQINKTLEFDKLKVSTEHRWAGLEPHQGEGSDYTVVFSLWLTIDLATLHHPRTPNCLRTLFGRLTTLEDNLSCLYGFSSQLVIRGPSVSNGHVQFPVTF